MKNEMRIKNIGELYPGGGNTDDLRKKVNCLTIDYQDVVSQVWDCSKWTTKVL